MDHKLRIFIASVIGLVMIGGSYWLAQRNEQARRSSDTLVVVAPTAIRQFVPVTDKDEDGLPDWQNSFTSSIIDLDERPSGIQTETASLAIELATLTSASSSIPTSAKITSLNQRLTQANLDKPFTANDLKVNSEVTPTSLRTYGNALAAIALDNAPPTGTESELIVLNRALLRNEPTILEQLAPTIASYESMVDDMLRVSVPANMTREHLSLMNVYQALLNDIKSFKGLYDDALPAMVRLRRYQADVEALYLAISALYLKLDHQGIVWTDADLAKKFINIE